VQVVNRQANPTTSTVSMAIVFRQLFHFHRMICLLM